ncbi:hypothetical protein [Nocardia australiensis]|uniref:hypothetical protein n=1 Tax=Nocardia australiensis TaxID=2887191 RepID=UPI001D1481F7|nr:hypothetical protein [Nocardia australiensis]
MTPIDALLAKLDCSNTTWPTVSVANAHHTMQVHLDCLVGECRAKTAAFKHLESEHRLVRDTGRTR